MTRFRHPRFARRGFTLVELMVATALVVLILTILAVAFGAGTESLSRLRSMGNMATDLRTTQAKLTADLESQHFEGGTSPVGLRLSDLKYNQLTSGGTQVVPPTAGFFRLVHGSGSTYEGLDAEGVISTRAINHSLEFTLKRQGTTPDDLFVVPATTPALLAQNATDTPLTPFQFVGKWARVRWYLDNPQTVSGVQTWTLYRCVRAIAPGTVTGLTADEQDLFAHLGGTTQTVNQLSDPATRTVALPGSQLGRYTPGTPHYGDDIVLTNVTSFEVKPVWDAGTGVRTARTPLAVSLPAAIDTVIPDGSIGATVPNSDFPYDDLPTVTENPTLVGQRVFDTWSGTQANWNVPNQPGSLPLRIRITALQVRVRVFDPKNLMSRQVTFVVPQ